MQIEIRLETVFIQLRRLALLLSLWAFALPATSFAQPEEVEQHTEEVVAEAFETDETSLNLSLGGSLNTGNTQAWKVDAGEDFRLVRGDHGLEISSIFSYGQANIDEDMNEDLVDTVRNFRAKARYDYFLTQMDALFLAAAFRWDTFAGLDARVQGQVGYMRNFFKRDKHRFWGEAGYDITYDNFDPDPLPNPDMPGEFLDGEQVVHSARLFLGYDNKLNEAVTFATGFEALINVESPEDTRLNWDNALRSSLGGDFQLEAKFSAQFDNVPVPGAVKLDTATTLTLIYSMI